VHLSRGEFYIYTVKCDSGAKTLLDSR
jgi:hypothetical protein